MAATIVFASSLLVVSALIITKAIELKREKKNMVLGVLGRLDSKSDKLISAIKFKSLQLVQSIRYIVLVRSKEIFNESFHGVKEKIKEELRTKHNIIIMGRKEIAHKGSVSFYLKKIAEDKSNGEKGKIE
jgi:hypothetical protein